MVARPSSSPEDGSEEAAAADRPGARVRLEVVGATPEEALQALSPLYDGSQWASDRTDGGYAYRYTATGDAGMTLRTSRLQGSIRGSIPPGDELVVQWLRSGRGVVDRGGDDLAMRPDAPTLFPAHRPFVFEYADYDQRIVHLGRDRVEQVAAERTGVAPERLRFDHTLLPAPGAVANWFDTVGLVSRTLARGDVSPLLWSELTRLAIVGLLELYPPAAPELPGPLLQPGAARLRRVVEHIHAHAELPLTPTDLARIADVSVRTLQESFAQVLGVSPMAYVRQVRLERARDDLRAATPLSATVADVARRWGFVHLGRFSAEYARRFGERPSDTLRR